MKNLTLATLTATVAIFGATNASALTLAQTDSASLGATVLDFSALNLTLDQYSGAGTLAKVEILISTTASGSISSPIGSGVTINFGLGGALIDATLPTFGLVTLNPNGVLAPVPVTPGGAAAVFAGNDNDAFSTIIAAQFAPFIGAGTFSVPIDGALANLLSTSGSGSLNALGTADVTITVNYYTNPAVPEVSTAVSAGAFALVGGLALLRARKVAKTA